MKYFCRQEVMQCLGTCGGNTQWPSFARLWTSSRRGWKGWPLSQTSLLVFRRRHVKIGRKPWTFAASINSQGVLNLFTAVPVLTNSFHQLVHKSIFSPAWHTGCKNEKDWHCRGSKTYIKKYTRKRLIACFRWNEEQEIWHPCSPHQAWLQG